MSPDQLFDLCLVAICLVTDSVLIYQSKTSFLCYMWKPLLQHPKRILLTAVGINGLVMVCTASPSLLLGTTALSFLVFSVYIAWIYLIYKLVYRAAEVTVFREEHIAYINGAIVYYRDMTPNETSPYLNDDGYTAESSGEEEEQEEDESECEDGNQEQEGSEDEAHHKNK